MKKKGAKHNFWMGQMSYCAEVFGKGKQQSKRDSELCDVETSSVVSPCSGGNLSTLGRELCFR